MKKKNDEIREALEIVQYVKELIWADAHGIRHFSDYMNAFGLYVFINSILTGIWRGLWLETLFLPFAYVMSKQIGILKSATTWLTGYLIVGLVYMITGSWQAVVVSAVIVSVILLTVGYILGFRGKESRKLKIVPYIGITWGVIWASAGLNIALFMDERILFIYSYASGMGLFITGILERTFMYAGLYSLFVIPLIVKFIPEISPFAHSIIGLLMFISGLKLAKSVS